MADVHSFPKPCDCNVLQLLCSVSTDLPKSSAHPAALVLGVGCPRCDRQFSVCLSHSETDQLFRSIRKYLKPKK